MRTLDRVVYRNKINKIIKNRPQLDNDLVSRMETLISRRVSGHGFIVSVHSQYTVYGRLSKKQRDTFEKIWKETSTFKTIDTSTHTPTIKQKARPTLDRSVVTVATAEQRSFKNRMG